MYCPNCGKDVGADEFCGYCGAKIEDMPARRFCVSCGTPLDYGTDKCPSCGADVKSIYKQEDAQQIQSPPAKKSRKGVIAVIVAAVIIIGAAAFAWVNNFFGLLGNKNANTDFAQAPEENIYHQDEPIKIMTKSYTVISADSDSPVVKALEDYVGEDLEFRWIDSQQYSNAIADVIGSGDYPHVMLITGKSAAFVQAVRSDMFWDISDIFEDPEKYPNLAQANPDVNHNISVDGKVYGIYRARELGRAGVSIRKDWLDSLGLENPQTIEEFSEVLRAFTEDDPDKNGTNDTYGMTVTNYLDGPADNLALWMGAPNGWGIDGESGELKPSFLFDEYTDALKLMGEWYQKGYINYNIKSLESAKWDNDFLTGRAGVIIDVADRARRLAQNIAELDAGAEVDVFGYVKRNAYSEPRTLPTAGYDGFYVFPKSTIKTHEDLERILTVMDKLNDLEAVNLMNYGVEGTHYTVDSDNYVTKNNNRQLQEDFNDLNQVSMGIVTYDNGLKTRYSAAAETVAEKVDEVYADNRKYIVSNPAAPYISETYTKNGPMLDDILLNAKMNFVTGVISEEEYKQELERWKKEGGNDYIREINEEYKKDTSVK